MSKLAANAKFSLLTMFLTTALVMQTARAQQDSAAASEQEAAIEVAQEDTAQLELDEPEESEARFVPTEEISQDLGVAFPVDI